MFFDHLAQSLWIGRVSVFSFKLYPHFRYRGIVHVHEQLTRLQIVACRTPLDLLLFNLIVIIELDDLRRSFGVLEHLRTFGSGGHDRQVCRFVAHVLAAVTADADTKSARGTGPLIQLNIAKRHHPRAYASYAQLIEQLLKLITYVVAGRAVGSQTVNDINQPLWTVLPDELREVIRADVR